MSKKYEHPWTHPQCPKVKRMELEFYTGLKDRKFTTSVDDWWTTVHLRECQLCRDLNSRLSSMVNLSGSSESAVAAWAALQGDGGDCATH